MIRRLLLLVFSVVLAAFSGWDAALAYWREQPSFGVPGFMVADLGLAVRRADEDLASAGGKAFDAGRMQAFAVAALRADPLDAAAMRQLGMAATLRASAEGQGPFVLAERISRRDLPGQLLLLDASARAGDLTSTLAHYDRALSVHPDAARTLYPILAGAVSDTSITTELTPYADRPWFLGMIGAAIDAGAGNAAVRPLLAAARSHWPADTLAPLYTRLLGKLVARGHYAEAQAVASQMPGVSAAALSAIDFSATMSDPRLAPLSWTLARTIAAEAQLGTGGSLTIRLASEQSAVVAERITMLTPGVYEFTQSLTYEAGQPHARLAWEIRCLDNPATPVWQQLVPDRSGQVTYRSGFTVPQACAAQRWHLTASGDVTQMDSTAKLDQITLVRR